MKQSFRAGLMAGILMLSGLALAQSDVGLPPAFLEAWPILGLILGTAAVLLAAQVVKSAVQWLKVRLQRRMPDVPHWLIHGVNLLLSACVGLIFVMEGRLDGDAVFGGIPWPWNWLIFTLAVFWRAGGQRDEEIEQAHTIARVRR